MQLEIESIVEKDILTLNLSGVIDISTIDILKYNINKLAGITKIVLNIENIRFIDSSGVGSIAKIIRECQQNKISIRVTNILPEVFEVFDILGLPEIFGEGIFEIKLV